MPVTLKIAVVLLWAQGAALLVLGVALASATAAGHATDTTASITEAVIAIVIGLLLGFLGLALLRGHRPARGPAIVLELMLLPVGYFMVQAGLTGPGLGAVVLGLLVAGLLLAPSTRESLGIH